jgi:DNA-binding CsgD family transcriptional regulator
MAFFWSGQLLAVALVVTTVFLSHRLYSLYRRDYLRDWFFFVVVLDLVLYVLDLLQRIAPFLDPNLGASQIRFHLFFTVLLVRPLVWIGLALFARFVLRLLGLRLTLGIKVSAVVYFGLHVLVLVLLMALHGVEDPDLEPLLTGVSDWLAMAGLYAMTAFILWKTNRDEHEERRAALRNLAVVFFFSQTVFCFFPFEHGRFLAGFVLMLLPILTLWLSHHCLFRQGMPTVEQASPVEAFFDRQGVTKREREIAWRISAGKNNQVIAKELFVSLPTVKHHVTSLFRKLAVRNRVQLNNLIKHLGETANHDSERG